MVARTKLVRAVRAPGRDTALIGKTKQVVNRQKKTDKRSNLSAFAVNQRHAYHHANPVASDLQPTC
ncbi:MAG: hypothetical protein HLUCCA01_05310 [Bacteroidetes bacterium HLUCCA01]|nr:MAG: hypothetical protein HLUCCA01_05310 [Bacteroidetes bacterium HLUCCA01]